MPNPERFDPSLLSERERDKAAQLHNFGYGEVLMKFCPKRVVGNIGIPDNGTRVSQSHLLTFGKLRGALEFEKLAILIFGQAFPPSLDGSLDPSVLALNRL